MNGILKDAITQAEALLVERFGEITLDRLLSGLNNIGLTQCRWRMRTRDDGPWSYCADIIEGVSGPIFSATHETSRQLVPVEPHGGSAFLS